jgi:hypothetical protein
MMEHRRSSVWTKQLYFAPDAYLPVEFQGSRIPVCVGIFRNAHAILKALCCKDCRIFFQQFPEFPGDPDIQVS